MPPPLTDEQLKAGFTDEEWTFYHWYEKNEAHLKACKTPLELVTFMRSEFPDAEQRKRFNRWSDKWFSRGGIQRTYWKASEGPAASWSPDPDDERYQREKRFIALSTDEEIKATFTPEEWSFYHWIEDTRAEFAACKTMLEKVKFMRRRFPDKEERKRYSEWSSKWLSREATRHFYRMTPEDFIDKIENTEFLDSLSVGKLRYIMDLYNTPVVLLGESDFDGLYSGYALQPGMGYLWPDTTVEGQGLEYWSMLAVNLDVKVDSQGQFSREVVDPQEPDDVGGSSSFVFFQIGALFHYIGDWELAREQDREDILDGTWRETGYGVVVQIDEKSGKPGAVWVIYNCWEIDEERHAEDEDEIPAVEKRKRRVLDMSTAGHVNRGEPVTDPSKRPPVFVAKIADDLRQLGDYVGNPRKMFDFVPEAGEPHQIVRVKKWTSQVHGPVLTPQYVSRT